MYTAPESRPTHRDMFLNASCPAQVIATARSADLILLMLDATKASQQAPLLEKELETVGIRINKGPPNVMFKPKKTGGIAFTATVPLSHMNEKLCYGILHEVVCRIQWALQGAMHARVPVFSRSNSGKRTDPTRRLSVCDLSSATTSTKFTTRMW